MDNDIFESSVRSTETLQAFLNTTARKAISFYSI